MRRIMEETNRTREEEGGEKTFAELFGETEPDRGWLKPGQRMEAVIVKISPEWVFIDVSGSAGVSG
jgi:ribosomal protein S1